MSVLTKPPTMGDVLKYELNPNFTRETVTLLAGTNYPVGAVLGRITASGNRSSQPFSSTWKRRTRSPKRSKIASRRGMQVARSPNCTKWHIADLHASSAEVTTASEMGVQFVHPSAFAIPYEDIQIPN